MLLDFFIINIPTELFTRQEDKYKKYINPSNLVKRLPKVTVLPAEE